MVTFGIMTLTMDSEYAYIDEIAKHSQAQGMEVFRFIPSEINPHSLQIQGKKFDPVRLRWQDEEFPIPSIIYDRCFYGDDEHSRQCIPIVNWLKNKKEILFLGYGLPNKLDLYKTLQKSNLAAYLPPTQPVLDCQAVLREVKMRKKIILKPINGSHGYGIYYVKKNEKTYHVKTEKAKRIISRIFPNEAKLLQWMQTLLKQHKYLLQPFLELSNDELQPYDIRILLQKDDCGKWVERGKGVRTGNTGGILSNLSAGGSAIDFSSWAATLPKSKHDYICFELEYIITNLPKLLEKEFMPLFEIGVDIGVAKDGSIWILDTNSKPGRKVLLQTQPDLKDILYLAPLLYGKYLAQNDVQERKRYYEKTLPH